MQTISKEQAIPPFRLVILDLFDANHFADFFEEEWRYAWLTGGYAPINNYDTIVALADRLFWALNPCDKTQKDWIRWEAGYDVRIYDADLSCIYKAHEKLPPLKPQDQDEILIDWLRDAEQIPEEGESIDDFIKRTGWTLEEDNKWRKIEEMPLLKNEEEYRKLLEE